MPEIWCAECGVACATTRDRAEHCRRLHGIEALLEEADRTYLWAHWRRQMLWYGWAIVVGTTIWGLIFWFAKG